MAEQIDLVECERAMNAAVEAAHDPLVATQSDFRTWKERVEAFSELCAKLRVKSHIAVLGNALLAKATNPRVDVYCLKAAADSRGAFDARRSAENVLVPASQRYKFSIGTTGPQPLNNQPFFRAYRIDTQLPVRKNLRPALEHLLNLLHEVQQLRSDEATRALAAFVKVRQQYVPKYAEPTGVPTVATLEDLAATIDRFVRARSDGGARAQAAVGGLLEALYSRDRVRVGKRNEPDRAAPGDVAVRSFTNSHTLERIAEVRDKNVPDHAAIAVITKAADAGVGRAMLVAVAADQAPFDLPLLRACARERDVDILIFTGWKEIIKAVIFASAQREAYTIQHAIAAIRMRLIELEVPEDSLTQWDEMTRTS